MVVQPHWRGGARGLLVPKDPQIESKGCARQHHCSSEKARCIDLTGRGLARGPMVWLWCAGA